MKYFLYFLTALIVAIVIFRLKGYVHIPVKSDFFFEEIGQQLGILFFLALVIERVQEVIMTSWRGAEASVNNRIVNKQRERVASVEKKLQSDAKTELDLNALQQELARERTAEERAVETRETHRSETRQRALLTGLVLGLITSLLGFRVLESIVDIDQWKKGTNVESAEIQPPPSEEIVIDADANTEKDPFESQATRFRLFDVLLTGMLIAGGSDGIHKIARALTDFAESSSEKSKKSAAAS